jgi:glycosyltransferase involved in cell wall biosynthesis
MLPRPTVLLLIPHLGGGGAEHVAVLLATGLNPRKYDVHLGLVAQRAPASHPLPTSVAVHALGARRVRYGAWKLLRLVWRLRPQVIISGIFHLNFLVLLMRPFFPGRCKVIIRQNGPANLESSARLRRFLYRVLYPRADAVICQTRAMGAEFLSIAGDPRKVRVLPNPVDLDAIRTIADNSFCHWVGPGPHLLAVGRLAREKGFDLLLPALASLRRQFRHADLAILGSGCEKPALEKLAMELGLKSVVRFAGYDPDPASWFRGASLFVLPSRLEGLPNALLEAAAAGLPIVATPASEGLRELLAGQPGMWLAESISVDGIAAAIESALGQLSDGERFSHPWVEAFRAERVIMAYESLIDEFLPEPAP